jgi:hypothetical protein
MGYIEIIAITPEDLDLCDSCNQQGRISSGKTICDQEGERMIFICFNCKQKIKE